MMFSRLCVPDVPMRNGMALDYDVDPKKREQASKEQRNPVRRRSADRGALKVGTINIECL